VRKVTGSNVACATESAVGVPTHMWAIILERAPISPDGLPLHRWRKAAHCDRHRRRNRLRPITGSSSVFEKALIQAVFLDETETTRAVRTAIRSLDNRKLPAWLSEAPREYRHRRVGQVVAERSILVTTAPRCGLDQQTLPALIAMAFTGSLPTT